MLYAPETISVLFLPSSLRYGVYVVHGTPWLPLCDLITSNGVLTWLKVGILRRSWCNILGSCRLFLLLFLWLCHGPRILLPHHSWYPHRNAGTRNVSLCCVGLHLGDIIDVPIISVVVSLVVLQLVVLIVPAVNLFNMPTG